MKTFWPLLVAVSASGCGFIPTTGQVISDPTGAKITMVNSYGSNATLGIAPCEYFIFEGNHRHDLCVLGEKDGYLPNALPVPRNAVNRIIVLHLHPDPVKHIGGEARTYPQDYKLRVTNVFDIFDAMLKSRGWRARAAASEATRQIEELGKEYREQKESAAHRTLLLLNAITERLLITDGFLEELSATQIDYLVSAGKTALGT